MSILKMFESHKLDSKIKSRNVTNAEKWLGYFIGPAGAVVFYRLLDSYLNVYYTDAIGATAWLGGAFLVIFPIISKIIDAVTNLAMANIIDRTKTRQGKLRPYMLMSAPLMTISGILLFAIPNMSQTGKMIWMVVSYNLFYAVSYTMYTISQQMLTATSTRNSDQRTVLGIFSSTSNFVMGGAIAFAFFPMLIYPILQRDPSQWATVMSIFSALILPLTFMQYFFTRERVTEENENLSEDEKIKQISFFKELKMLCTNKFWICLMLALFAKEFALKICNCAMMYYSNWVVASDYTQGGTYYATINMIGGTVSGFIGILIVWPLAKKLGKTRLATLSLLMMGIFMGVCAIFPRSWMMVLPFYVIAQIGSSLSLYVVPAMLADVVDNCEYEFGIRSDAITGAMMSIVYTVTAGLGTGLFNGVLAATGYQMPELLLNADGTYGAQAAGVQNAIVLMAFGVPAALLILAAFLMSRDKAEKILDKVQTELIARKKAEAAAAGIEWVDPVEAARAENLHDIDENYEVELEKLKKKLGQDTDKYAKAKTKLDAKFQKKRDKVNKAE